MTFCKELKSAAVGGLTVSAWEETEKYSSAPEYKIAICEGSIAREVIKTARTTWKKKFDELVKEIGG